MIQPTLEDALAEQADALERVERHADHEWKRAAAGVIHRYARGGLTFTSDDIMFELERMPVTTHDPRALGPVMKQAKRCGLIVQVGWQKSVRRHGSPIALYQGGVQ